MEVVQNPLEMSYMNSLRRKYNPIHVGGNEQELMITDFMYLTLSTDRRNTSW